MSMSALRGLLGGQDSTCSMTQLMCGSFAVLPPGSHAFRDSTNLLNLLTVSASRGFCPEEQVQSSRSTTNIANALGRMTIRRCWSPVHQCLKRLGENEDPEGMRTNSEKMIRPPVDTVPVPCKLTPYGEHLDGTRKRQPNLEGQRVRLCVNVKKMLALPTPARPNA